MHFTMRFGFTEICCPSKFFFNILITLHISPNGSRGFQKAYVRPPAVQNVEEPMYSYGFIELFTYTPA